MRAGLVLAAALALAAGAGAADGDLLAAKERYLPPAQAVKVPITAIGWEEDLDVSATDLAEWREYGETREYLLPGEPLQFLAAPRGLRCVMEDDFAD